MDAPTLPLSCCLLGLAACASAPVARLAPTPPGLPAAVVRIDEVRADQDRSPAAPGTPSPFVHDPAVRSIFGGVATESPVEAAIVAPAAPSPATDVFHEPCAVRGSREPFVPAATIFGAGLGAALSARGHRGDGALLGAGIGLLFDLQRAGR